MKRNVNTQTTIVFANEPIGGRDRDAYLYTHAYTYTEPFVNER